MVVDEVLAAALSVHSARQGLLCTREALEAAFVYEPAITNTVGESLEGEEAVLEFW
jgi:hypothetical protein